MKALLAAAIIPACLATAAVAQLAPPPPEAAFTIAPKDPRARPMPNFLGVHPWVRWYCNPDGSNCQVLRRHRTQLQCQRALAFYLAEIRGHSAHCTYEGDASQTASS
jgi:hypothetical protein